MQNSLEKLIISPRLIYIDKSVQYNEQVEIIHLYSLIFCMWICVCLVCRARSHLFWWELTVWLMAILIPLSNVNGNIAYVHGSTVTIQHARPLTHGGLDKMAHVLQASFYIKIFTWLIVALEILMKLWMSTFQVTYSDWWLRYLLWNCPQKNVTRPYWW